MTQSITEKEYLDHLAQEHRVSPFSTYLKEIVYGGIDGIITTFAVVAGFSGAQAIGGAPSLPILTVLLFGFANLFADATSMGLGNLLSIRADQDVYKKEEAKERDEVIHNPSFEIAETVHLLQTKGFTKSQASKLTEIYSKNEDYWVDFMMREELEMPNPMGENPYLSGFATFFSFIVFGAIPLVPYVLLQNVVENPFISSIAFAAAALLLLGILRWKVTNEKVVRSIGETLLVGILSAVVAYFVGTFFRA